MRDLEERAVLAQYDLVADDFDGEVVVDAENDWQLPAIDRLEHEGKVVRRRGSLCAPDE